MSVPLHADTMASSADEINRRLRNLEQANPFEHSAIFNGALKIFDANANLTMSIGLQDDGTYGLRAYNPATGAVVLQLGPQTDGTNGLSVSDPTGVKQVQVGQQAGSSLYGLSVLNKATSVMQQVAGVVGATTETQITVTSTSFVSDPGGPSVNATIGPSGQAYVSIGAQITTNDPATGTADIGFIAAAVDGTVVVSGTGTPQVEVSGAGGTSSSYYAVSLVTGLTPGGHTFAHRYSVLAGTGTPPNQAIYGLRSITVQPL